MTLVLVVAAAVAWYVQDRQRPGAGSSAVAQDRRLRSPLVRLADLVGIQTARGRRANQWAAGAVGEKATAVRLKPLVQGVRHEARAVSRALKSPVIPIVSMEGPPESPHPRGEWVFDFIRIAPADRIVPALRAIGRRRATGPHPGARAAALFPAYRRK